MIKKSNKEEQQRRATKKKNEKEQRKAKKNKEEWRKMKKNEEEQRGCLMIFSVKTLLYMLERIYFWGRKLHKVEPLCCSISPPVLIMIISILFLHHDHHKTEYQTCHVIKYLQCCQTLKKFNECTNYMVRLVRVENKILFSLASDGRHLNIQARN